MGHSVPTLRKHARGYYFVRWGGKDHYLSRDKTEAERLFRDPTGGHAGALVNWLKANELKKRSAAASRTNNLRVIDVSTRFLDHYLLEGRDSTMKYYRRHLTRFLAVFGTLRISQLDIGALQSFRADLLKLELAPRTIGHDIGAIKTMLTWAADHELGPLLNLRAIKKPFNPPPTVVRLTYAQVCRMMRSSHRCNPNLTAHLALNYLCLMRPSEVVRLVNGEGHFDPVVIHERVGGSSKERIEPRGVFVLDRSKTERRMTYPRTVVMTDQALAWLDAATPGWKNLGSYSSAVRAACGPGGPKLLQKAAVWHLQLTGVAEEETDKLLGHGPNPVWRHYGRREWSVLRERASRISV